MQAAGDLDSYLDEIDRRLRRVQLELVETIDLPPDSELPPPEPPAPPAPRAPAPQPVSRLHTKLLATMRDLVDAFEAALGEQPAVPASVLLSAGPFSTLEQVHEFEHQLERLPGVREVTVRGYEGDDRAILAVELGDAARRPRPV